MTDVVGPDAAGSVPAWPPRSRWRRLVRPVLMAAALVLVFGWVLPQFIDYDDVWSALRQLDPWEIVALGLLGLARIPTEALMYRAFLPSFALLRGSEAYLSSNLAGQLLPPPSATVVQYGYFREGYSPDAARVAAFGGSSSAPSRRRAGSEQRRNRPSRGSL